MPLHPHNILLLDNKKIEIFNLVDHEDKDPAKRNFIKRYNAPEWNPMKKQTNSSIIYSLGCVLYQMCTLRNDFRQAKPSFEKNSPFHPNLQHFILLMMSH